MTTHHAHHHHADPLAKTPACGHTQDRHDFGRPVRRSAARRAQGRRERLWLSVAAVATFTAGLCVGLVGCAKAPVREDVALEPAPIPLTPETRELYRQSFDQVWKTIKDRHWDPAKVGESWDAAGAELRPKIEQVATAEEAVGVLNELIARLEQSHFGVVPAEAYTRFEEEQTVADDAPRRNVRESASQPEATRPASEPGSAGLELRVLGPEAVVFRVTPGGAADRAGVKPGWILAEADGRPLAPTIEAVRDAVGPDSTTLEAMLAEVARARVSGDAGDEVPAVFIDGAGARVPLTLTLGPIEGDLTRLGNLPPMHVTFDSKTLATPARGLQVGYLTFSAFLNPPILMQRINSAMAGFASHRGVVIDMRGNVGGLIPMAMGVGGWFVQEPNQRLGTLITRDTRLNMVLNPRLGSFAGPVAVLIDGNSVSAAEILAGGLQDIGRARVFGSRTAGACLPSTFERLPSGDGFQYAFADYISYGGRVLEGQGVLPDEPITLTREALLRGEDPALDAALRWIESQVSAEPQPGS